jgi:sulfide:quinone oxidoreductase
VVAALLEAAGVHVATNRAAVGLHDGALVLADGERLEAGVVFAAPRLAGPRIAGLPADAEGFLPIDAHCAVVAGVYAAGDVTAGPFKQSAVAAQQADAAAAAIAAESGADVRTPPCDPVLRGLLLTGGEPLYLRRGPADAGVASHQALWWPPVKVPGRHLASFVISGGASAEPLVDRDPDGEWRLAWPHALDLKATLQHPGRQQRHGSPAPETS